MTNVIEYLELNASRLPQKTAVAMRDEKITFSELVKCSRRLANAIPKSECTSPVIVLANRKASVAILILAVIYSGNFYVPIDPGMPLEKIQAIIDDCTPSAILGDDESSCLIESLNFNGEFLTLNDAKESLCDIPDVGGDDPLYMVYTSGSTGIPKGVLKSHKSVISYIDTFFETFNFNENDIIGNQTPFFFDASAKDFYLMLKTGATLEIIPTELFAMPPMLIEYLNNKRISFISWVPTALSIVSQLRTFSYILPTSLKQIFFVGEAMPMKHLNNWRSSLPDLQYVNLYGFSEIAGVCCYYEVKRDFNNDDSLPIGKPLKNCRIHLVDCDTLVNKPNCIGEIFVESDSLALNYYNDDEKTKKSFIYKDFGEGLVRCYKSGDLAYYDDNMDLIFVSRFDYQIKHMGHRIELGEIETVVGAIPEIQRCCCLYDSLKSKIVLFCELSEKNSTLSSQQILSKLRPKLSSYMLPNRVVVLENIPINSNGKIDRQKLKSML